MAGDASGPYRASNEEEADMTKRREFLQHSAAALAALAAPRIGRAQHYPSKLIRAVVPFTPGSTLDVVSRIVAEALSQSLGQQIIIENRAGAGGTIGTAVVAKAAPDGYTLLMQASAHSAAPAAFPAAPYDARADFSGVATFGITPNVIVVAADRGIKTIQQLAEVGRKGNLTFSSAGIGSATHWAAERFRVSAGFPAVHVPHKGGPEALADVAAGRVDFMASGASSALPMIKAGRVVPLAVTTPRRAKLLPELPTTLEAGFADSDYTFWNGLLVPAKTPRPIVERLHAEVVKALQQPAVAEALAKQGLEPMVLSPAEFDAMIAKEIAANLAIVKAAGLKFH
jgi:tripartite-type tricarboxylate transporter receptor subunit TctC